jgi:hypothetical protein
LSESFHSHHTSTLANFLAHFLAADNDRKELATLRSPGFHGANAVTPPPILNQDTTQAIAAAIEIVRFDFR